MSEDIAVAKLRDLCKIWCKYAEEDAASTSQSQKKATPSTAPHLILPIENLGSSINRKSVKITRILSQALSEADVELFTSKLHHKYHFSTYENERFMHECGWTHKLGPRTLADETMCYTRCSSTTFLRIANYEKNVYRQGSRRGEETCSLSCIRQIHKGFSPSLRDSSDTSFANGYETSPVSTKDTYVLPYIKREDDHRPRTPFTNSFREKFYKPSTEEYVSKAIVFWPKVYSDAIELSTYDPLRKARMVLEFLKLISAASDSEDITAYKDRAQRFLSALAKSLGALARNEAGQDPEEAVEEDVERRLVFNDIAIYVPELIKACAILDDKESLAYLLGIEELAGALRPLSPRATGLVIKTFGVEAAKPILEAIFTYKSPHEAYGYAGILQDTTIDDDVSCRVLEILFTKLQSLPTDKPRLSLQGLRQWYNADQFTRLIAAIPKTQANLEYWIRQFDADLMATAALRPSVVPELVKTLEKQDYRASVKDELLLYKLLKYTWTDNKDAKELQPILEAYLSLLQSPSIMFADDRQVAATRKLENIHYLLQGRIIYAPFKAYFQKNLQLFHQRHGEVIQKGRPDPSEPRSFKYPAPSCTCAECYVLHAFMKLDEESKSWQTARRHHLHLTESAKACGRVQCVSFQPQGTTRYHFKVTKQPKSAAERLKAYNKAVTQREAIIELNGGRVNVHILLMDDPEPCKTMLGASSPPIFPGSFSFISGSMIPRAALAPVTPSSANSHDSRTLDETMKELEARTEKRKADHELNQEAFKHMRSQLEAEI